MTNQDWNIDEVIVNEETALEDGDRLPDGEASAVVLLSGGLDSMVALAAIEQTNPVIAALFFNYGQRAYESELKAARAIAIFYEIPLVEIPLLWLAGMLPEAMRDDAPETAWAQAEPRPDADSTRQVWIPNRNGVLLNIAAAYAEGHGAQVVIFGANADEAHGFPDNTVQFRQRLNESLALSTLSHVRVEAPLENLTKREIIALGESLEAPLHLRWSCYEAGTEPCQRCPSCQLSEAAFLSMGPASVGL